MRLTSLCLLSLSLLPFAGCTSEAATNAAPTELRFSVIPDSSKAKLVSTAKDLEAYLTKKLGIPVKYQDSSDYTAAVNGLSANKLDFVWLGGKTTVDALDQDPGKIEILATRDIDLKFKSYFIANKASIASGKIKEIKDLAELKPLAKDLTFTFGDKNSTSGHLMPRHFLTVAKIDPNKDFKGEAGHQANHNATLTAVASGTVDLGALNYATYDGAKPEEKENAPIIYTTPDYVDYAWVAHSRIGADMVKKLREAFLSIDASKPDEKAILTGWSAKERFVAADASQWDGIRKVRDSLPKGFLK